MANQSTKDRGIPDKSPKTDFTIPYLPSESIFKSKHEKTVQMETDFSAAKTRNSDLIADSESPSSIRCSEGRTKSDDKGLFCYYSTGLIGLFWIRRAGFKMFWPVWD